MSTENCEQDTKTIRCMECHKECNGREAGKHKKDTGHNRWELIAPLIKEG